METSAKPKRMVVWKYQYRPFTLGGNVHQPIKCGLDVTGPFDVEGYEVYVTISPSGETFIVDAISGGIIGDSIEQVRTDVLAGRSRLYTTADKR